MTMTSQNMASLLDEVVGAVSMGMFYESDYFITGMYDIRSSNKRREKDASFGELSEWDEQNPGQEVAADGLSEEFTKEFVHTKYGKKVPVEDELIEDQEFNLIMEIGRQIGTTGRYTLEKKCVLPFHDAFTGASYKAEDGLSICNAAHVNGAGGNSQSNTGTTAFSLAALKSTRSAMRQFKNYNGDLAGVMPNGLLVPGNIEEDAFEALQSIDRPDSTNRTANFYRGQFRLFVSDFLSTAIDGGDNNNWFMLDLRLMAQNLILYMRKTMEFFGDGDLFAGTRRFGGSMRFSNGVKDWRWIYGHNV